MPHPQGLANEKENLSEILPSLLSLVEEGSTGLQNLPNLPSLESGSQSSTNFECTKSTIFRIGTMGSLETIVLLSEQTMKRQYYVPTPGNFSRLFKSTGICIGKFKFTKVSWLQNDAK